MSKSRFTILLTLLTILLVSVVPAYAESGAVDVTATQAAKISITLDTGAVAFGTNLEPSGVASNEANVAAYQDGTNGAVYVANGSASAYAVTARVSSNAAWTGSVSATENGGGAGMTIANGDLLWSLGDMADGAAALTANAFTVAADNTAFDTATSCDIGATLSAGNCTYSYDYALRVQWTDAPGTFTTTVTYAVSQ